MERNVIPILLLVLVIGGIYLYQAGYLSGRESGLVVAFQKIAEGENAAVSKRVNYRIQTADELAQLWQDLNIEEPPPAVDFSKSEVAAVFAGLAPSSGYDIGVIKVVDSKEERTVLIELKRPESECGSAQDAVSPFELIMLPRTKLRLTHIDQPVSVQCPQQ